MVLCCEPGNGIDFGGVSELLIGDVWAWGWAAFTEGKT